MKGEAEPRKDWISGDSWQLIKWAQTLRADLRISRANVSGMRVAVAFNAWKWIVADDGTDDEWVGAARTSWLMGFVHEPPWPSDNLKSPKLANVTA